MRPTLSERATERPVSSPELSWTACAARASRLRRRARRSQEFYPYSYPLSPSKSGPEHRLRRGLQKPQREFDPGDESVRAAVRSAVTMCRWQSPRRHGVQRGIRDSRTDRSALPAVLLRSPVPGTAGNRREQPTPSLSVFADIPACSRLFPVLKFIGEVAAILLPAGAVGERVRIRER
jgi:hypothetical protein